MLENRENITAGYFNSAWRWGATFLGSIGRLWKAAFFVGAAYVLLKIWIDKVE
jgi:hypothetical protein